MTWTVRVLCVSCVLASVRVSVNANPPVRWTFYRDMSLTWNEASQFCRDLGGHLPVISSSLTHSVLFNWIQEWERQGYMTGPVWTGLYSPKPGVAPYVWERGGVQQSSDVTFWQTSAGEPNNVAVELCTRMPSNGMWLTRRCSYEFGVVCEFYKDCCTYTRFSDTAALHTVSSFRADVTSLEKCWSECEGDVTCVSAVRHAETAKCNASSEAREVTLALRENQNASAYLLQGCFIAETTQWSNPFTFNDTSDVAQPAEPLSVAPQNFQCTLTLIVSMETPTPPTEATITTELESIHSTVPDTTQSQTTADTTQSQTIPDTSEPVTSTTTELVQDVNASSSSAVLRQCPCSCPERLTTVPPPPPLEIVMANSTSKFRRVRTSEWSSPSLSESVISITCVTIAAMFVLFVLCPHPAAMEKCFCSRGHKISASRST